MKVLLYDKVCVHYQLMNGCECRIEHIVFDERENANTSKSKSASVQQLSFLPIAIFARIEYADFVLLDTHNTSLPAHVDRRGLLMIQPSSKY